MAGALALLSVMAGAQAGLSAVPTTQVQIQGEGASFPSLVYSRWAARYNELGRGVQVAYTPTGSGKGVQQIKARHVAFGGTDVPLTPAQLSEAHLVQIPMLVGGLVPVVNLPGVASNQLVLDGPVLGDIMLNRITRWDDPRIARLNPGVSLPGLRIQRVVRSDASGSTEMFLRYLAAAAPGVQTALPPSQRPAWPGSVVAADGNDGVSRAVRQLPGGIGTVSYDRVLRDDLRAVRLIGAQGKPVTAGPGAFQQAILGSDLYRRGDDLASLVHLKRAEAWPITATSYVLLDARPADAAKAQATARFVFWCFMQGDELTRGTGFSALPARAQARLAGRLLEIKTTDGGVIDLGAF